MEPANEPTNNSINRSRNSNRKTKPHEPTSPRGTTASEQQQQQQQEQQQGEEQLNTGGPEPIRVQLAQEPVHNNTSIPAIPEPALPRSMSELWERYKVSESPNGGEALLLARFEREVGRLDRVAAAIEQGLPTREVLPLVEVRSFFMVRVRLWAG